MGGVNHHPRPDFFQQFLHGLPVQAALPDIQKAVIWVAVIRASPLQNIPPILRCHTHNRPAAKACQIRCKQTSFRCSCKKDCPFPPYHSMHCHPSYL